MPPAAPVPRKTIPEGADFYVLDYSRGSFREFFYGNPWHRYLLIAISAVIVKLFRVSTTGSSDHAPVASPKPFEVSEADFPPDIRAEFEPVLKEMAAAGFADPVFHMIIDPLNATDMHWATLRHESGTAWARIHRRQWNYVRPPKRYLLANYHTRFADGTWLFSTSGKRDTLEPGSFRVNRHKDMDATALWASHRARLAATPSMVPVPVNDREGLLDQIGTAHSDLKAFHTKRGFFKVPDEAALKTLASVRSTGGVVDEDTAIREEMHKIAFGKPGWGNFAIILIVSLLAFLGAGAGGKPDWKYLITLVPVLLIHELGHYVAMRTFGYRNLRMFFIPFFGAAVSGKHYSVAGWKKAIVSLAGPVPSIIVAVVAGGIGLITRQPWLMEAAFVSIFINAFNLVPVLPLDGGWVVHATLFSRHHLLDTAFRVVAAVGLLVFGHFLDTRLFFFIALSSMLALPISYKLAKIVADLRTRNLVLSDNGNAEIPVDTANTIIEAVRAKFPTGANRKTIALHALNVFETLNAKPPQWPATIALLALHGGTVVVAVIFGVLFAVGARPGGLMSAIYENALGASPVQCNSTLVWQGSQWDVARSNDLMVANFKTRDDAESQFASTTNDLPETASLTCFGNTLLLALPSGNPETRERWFMSLERGTTNISVAPPESKTSISLSFKPASEDQGKLLEEELGEFFSLPSIEGLAPPWWIESHLSDSERTKLRRTRKTWLLVENVKGRAYTNASVRAYNSKIATARRRGDTSLSKSLESEQASETERIQRTAVESLKNDPEIDSEFLDLCLALPRPDYARGTNGIYAKALKALRPKFGELTGTDQERRHQGFQFAWSYPAGKQISISATTSANDPAPLLMLTEWLCKKGCTDLKYSIGTGSDRDEDEPE